MNETAATSPKVFEALQSTGIPYVIVGSIASSFTGEARHTQDIDILAAMQPRHVGSLVTSLTGDFYLDEEPAVEALRRNRSFNVISLKGLLKFDFFPAGADTFAASQLRRRRMILVEFLSPDPLPVASPEDTVLAKLRLYNDGGRVSENQWKDILGVLRVPGERIDWAYIEEWAPRLGVADLLEKLPRFV